MRFENLLAVVGVSLMVVACAESGAAPAASPSTPTPESSPAPPLTTPQAAEQAAPSKPEPTPPTAKTADLAFRCISGEGYEVFDRNTGKPYDGKVRLKQTVCNLGGCTGKPNIIRNEKTAEQHGVCMNAATESFETHGPSWDLKVWSPDKAPANAKKNGSDSGACLNAGDHKDAVCHRDSACSGTGLDVVMSVEPR